MNGLKAADITPDRDRLQHAHLGRRGDASDRLPVRPTTRTPRRPTAVRRLHAGAWRRGTTASTRTPPPRRPLPRVRHFEIWNEPNLKNFFRFNSTSLDPQVQGADQGRLPAHQVRQPERRRHRRRRRAAQQHGQRQHRRPGLAEQAGAATTRQVRRLLAAHLPVVGPKFTSPASRRRSPRGAASPEIFTTLDMKRKGMKLYITEAGYTTGATPFRTVKVTPAVQNQYLKQIFTLPHGQEPAHGGGGLVQPPGQHRTGPAGCCAPTAARSRPTPRS